MVRVKRENRGAEGWQVILGVLFVALLIFAGTLSVAHGHDDGSIDHADCSLCATAHVTVQMVAALPDAPTSVVFAKIDLSPRPIRRQALERYALYTRPPPARTTLTS